MLTLVSIGIQWIKKSLPYGLQLNKHSLFMHKCSSSHGLAYALTKLANWWSSSKFWWNNPWSRWSFLWNNPYHGLGGFHCVLGHFFGVLFLNSNEMVNKPSNSSGDDGFGDFDCALITIVGDIPSGNRVK